MGTRSLQVLTERHRRDIRTCSTRPSMVGRRLKCTGAGLQARREGHTHCRTLGHTELNPLRTLTGGRARRPVMVLLLVTLDTEGSRQVGRPRRADLCRVVKTEAGGTLAMALHLLHRTSFLARRKRRAGKTIPRLRNPAHNPVPRCGRRDRLPRPGTVSGDNIRRPAIRHLRRDTEDRRHTATLLRPRGGLKATPRHHRICGDSSPINPARRRRGWCQVPPLRRGRTARHGSGAGPHPAGCLPRSRGVRPCEAGARPPRGFIWIRECLVKLFAYRSVLILWA
mmetsp:Transcript_1362/g.3779  ORF Transcript_1362/g.3779 Transcript_1362/m.3779 type:complete len:282 (+) Transcript_1362:1268-2113(+)